MYLLQYFLLFCTLTTVSALCTNDPWTFTSMGQYHCNYSNSFIRGFERGDYQGNEDYIDNLKGALCCTALWSSKELLTQYSNWEGALVGTFAWAYCESGFFLHGLYRSDDKRLRLMGFRCTKPASHPLYYGDCYEEDISTCFGKKGTCSCREDYFVTALYKGPCDKLYCLDTLRCCSMAKTPSALNSPSAVKTRVMESSLMSMAKLADRLGYEYCAGIHAIYQGEDFSRQEDDWVANHKHMLRGGCKGSGCDKRLRLAFGDWHFDVKDITYGQSVVQKFPAESLYSGTIYNKDNTPLTEQLQITENIEETITHSATTSWRSSSDLEVKLEFNIGNDIFSVGSSQTFRTSYEHSSSSTNEIKTLKLKTFLRHTSKTLAPLSAAKYTVIVNKVRTTIPYTAVIITRFSTEFTGHLKWNGVWPNNNTNYHFLYRGSAYNKYWFNYRFGSNRTAFYTALKEESDSQSMPWLWNEMMKQYPGARNDIERLAEETQYMFLLNGKLELVTGTNIDVVWEAVNLTRREVLDGTKTQTTILNFTHKLTSGPNDKPAKIAYPEVSLLPAEPYSIEVIPV